MENYKKSGENVVNFIVDSLKGKPVPDYSNGKLPLIPEMRQLGTSKLSSSATSIASSSASSKSVGSVPNFIKILFKLLGLLLLLFIIYKILESNPIVMAKLQTMFSKAEKEIKIIENEIVPNPIFDVSNNLNSNQILDFLLGTKKTEVSSEWCFIGEANGKRYCTLSQGNECMSGNIFPSENICINPKLKS